MGVSAHVGTDISVRSCSIDRHAQDGAMLGLTDKQLSIVLDGAANLATDKRSTYLERIGAALTLRGSSNTDRIACATARSTSTRILLARR